MCVKFQLSVSESSRDIKGIVRLAGSVHLQAREWQLDPDSACQRHFPLLPPTATIRYSLIGLWIAVKIRACTTRRTR